MRYVVGKLPSKTESISGLRLHLLVPCIVAVLGIHGINRQVILLYGSLPSAVINYVLTAKYTRNSELTASIIVLSTLLSLATVPFVFWLIR